RFGADGRDENLGSTGGAERPEMGRAERAAKRWPKGPANPSLPAMVIFDSRFSIFDGGTHRFGADGRDENPGSTEGAKRPEMGRAERAAKRWPRGQPIPPSPPWLFSILDFRFSIGGRSGSARTGGM